MDTIVVGVDRTDTAHRAAEAAARLAATCGANLHVLTCVRPNAPYQTEKRNTRNLDSIHQAEQFLRRLTEALPHDRISSQVGLGDPAVALCDEATRLQAGMIVVGNRRVQGASRVLGSIAADVAKRAGCDVLIANTTGDQAA